MSDRDVLRAPDDGCLMLILHFPPPLFVASLAVETRRVLAGKDMLPCSLLTDKAFSASEVLLHLFRFLFIKFHVLMTPFKDRRSPVWHTISTEQLRSSAILSIAVFLMIR